MKRAPEPAVLRVLALGHRVVLDFAADTERQREWLRSLVERSSVLRQLHFVDTAEATCREQLRERAARCGGDPLQDGATFDRLLGYFRAPTSTEGFEIVRHARPWSVRTTPGTACAAGDAACRPAPHM